MSRWPGLPDETQLSWGTHKFHLLAEVHWQNGVRVIRIFIGIDGFKSRTSVRYPTQPTFGTYSETALQRIDYCVYAAGRVRSQCSARCSCLNGAHRAFGPPLHRRALHSTCLPRKHCHDLAESDDISEVQIGIRLLPVLVNFWEDFGGVQFYVNAALGPGQQLENFYTHLGIRNYYKRWVRGVWSQMAAVTAPSRIHICQQATLCGATQQTPTACWHRPQLLSSVYQRVAALNCWCDTCS